MKNIFKKAIKNGSIKVFSCPVCYNENSNFFIKVIEHSYYLCSNCNVIFISPEVLDKMDNGYSIVDYKGEYWNEELRAAKERSWGNALARVAEVFLYARLPIKKFIDIGSGPGYILDAISHQLPSSSDIFYACELFPPAEEYCTKNKNFIRGNFKSTNFSFDAGSCIEVIEHLTPAMVKQIFSDMALKSEINSIYIFNTGLVDYIKNEDIGYLDPYVRGHVMGWSIKALQILAQPFGFQIYPIPGKTWAFIAEYRPDHNFKNNIVDRIWHVVPENKSILSDSKTGNLMYVLGLETVRAYR
jgi:hypothetical protein